MFLGIGLWYYRSCCIFVVEVNTGQQVVGEKCGLSQGDTSAKFFWSQNFGLRTVRICDLLTGVGEGGKGVIMQMIRLCLTVHGTKTQSKINPIRFTAGDCFDFSVLGV